MKPQWVLAVYWLVVVAANALLYPSGLVTSSAVGFLILVVLAFTIGVRVSLAPGEGMRPADALRSLGISRPILRIAIVSGAVCNVLAGVAALRTAGQSIGGLLSLDGLLASSNSVSIYRYTNGGLGQLSIPILLTMGYSAAIVAPFVRLSRGKHSLILVLLPVASSLFYAAVSTERLGFIYCSAATAGGWIAVYILQHGVPPRLRLRTVAGFTASAILVGAAFTGIAFLRVGRVDAVVATAISEKQVIYGLGGLPAFSQWFKAYDRIPSKHRELGYGTATLAGVEYFTGLERDDTRGYGEFVVIDTQGRSSNVYTGFRSLILDFGEAGSVFLMGILGFIFGRTFRATRRGSLAGAVGLAYAYALILVSSWSAVTTFTNIVAAGVLALLTISLARYGYNSSEKRLVPTGLGDAPNGSRAPVDHGRRQRSALLDPLQDIQ